ncbi:DUF6432 family protein [Haloferax prahovense]
MRKQKGTPCLSDARQTGGTSKQEANDVPAMRARREFRNRRDIEVAVLDALVDRHDEGMTVFELRAAVDADIDTIEEALSALKDEGLIVVEEADTGVLIHADERVVPDPSEAVEEDASLFERLRERFGL